MSNDEPTPAPDPCASIPAIPPAGPELGAPPPLPEPPPMPTDVTPPSARANVEPPPLPSGSRFPWLAIATGLVGLIQFALSIPASNLRASDGNISQRIGMIIGCLAVWPLILIGLFAIGRRFRTPRTRQVIMLTVWGLFALSHLGNLSQAQRLRAVPPAGPEPAAEVPLEPEGEPEAVENSAPPVSQSGQPVAFASESLSLDYSAGSAQRMIALIEGAQKDRYRAVASGYAQACARHPTDVVVALERITFIERFAYSEDFYIEGAEEDLEQAEQYLQRNFPRAGGTILRQLRQTAFDALEAAAAGHAAQALTWLPEEQAEFYLLRARAADQLKKPQAREFAKRSFALNPGVEAGLLLASKLKETGERAECLAVLTHPVFKGAEPWIRKSVLLTMAEIGQVGPAAELYAEIKAVSPDMLRDAALATAFGKAGRVDLAREIFDALANGPEWLRKQSVYQHFAFELEHGNAEQQTEAYRRLRAEGLFADPFLRYRFELFHRHPGMAWEMQDLVGALMLALLLLMSALAPLLVLLPVHYWSLLRERRGKTGGWADPHWGLRHAWLVLGGLLGLSLAAVWILKPEEMRSWTSGTESPAEVLRLPGLLPVQAGVWLLLSLVLVGLLWRRRAWAIFRTQEWSLTRCLLVGGGLALAGRFCLGVYLKIWPMTGGAEVAAINETAQLVLQTQDKLGAFGLLAVVALFVPVYEETLFRGVTLQALGKHLPFGWANFLQAAAFAAVHENVHLMPFYFGLGFACGELTRRSRSLVPAIVMHAVNNGITCLLIVGLQRSAGS